MVKIVYNENMQLRKDVLTNDHYYHVYSRSIAKFVVFNNAEEYSRMIEILKLYRFSDFNYKYSRFIGLEPEYQQAIINGLKKEGSALINIISYCLMPTHIHFILKQVMDKGISKYISRVLNSYARFFNVKHRRVGPLWAGRFKSVLVSGDEQMLHLTRYHHLNPTSANLVMRPEDWKYSSYREYIQLDGDKEQICSLGDILDINPREYTKFVSDRISYQKEISKIKNIILDDYTG